MATAPAALVVPAVPDDPEAPDAIDVPPLPLPTTEALCRPLVKLRGRPGAMRAAWAAAVRRAERAGRPVRVDDVRRAVQARLAAPAPRPRPRPTAADRPAGTAAAPRGWVTAAAWRAVLDRITAVDQAWARCSGRLYGVSHLEVRAGTAADVAARLTALTDAMRALDPFGAQPAGAHRRPQEAHPKAARQVSPRLL
jgi:hypothetical protein